MSFTLPDLPYAYDALEPAIDAETMRVHHDKHHAGYVKNLNAAVAEYPEYRGQSLRQILRSIHLDAGPLLDNPDPAHNVDQVPMAIRTAVRHNGGGHYNHSVFWATMSPGGGGEPSGELADAVTDAFGSFGAFRKELTTAATSVFGAGWAWLEWAAGALQVTTYPNQDSGVMEGAWPLVGIDVWEHAYYLKHQNVRADYVSAWWDVVDWDEVGIRFTNAAAERDESDVDR